MESQKLSGTFYFTIYTSETHRPRKRFAAKETSPHQRIQMNQNLKEADGEVGDDMEIVQVPLIDREDAMLVTKGTTANVLISNVSDNHYVDFLVRIE